MSLVKLENFEEQLGDIKKHLPEYLKMQGHDITNGKKIKCINPDHDDSHPSMSSFTTKEGHEVVRCFSCNFSADIFKAAHVLEHKPMIGPGFVEDNVRYLAAKFNIELKLKQLSEEEIYEINTYQAYRLAAEYISASPFTDIVLKQLEARGWEEKFVRGHMVGTCDDYEKMRSVLKTAGYSARFLDEVDLSNRNIFSPDNLIFTVCDDHGRPVGFAARNLKFDGLKDENGRLVKGPKFNNTRTTGLKCNIYRKSERLYLMHSAKIKAPPLYIVEGYGDAISLQQAGLKNTVAIGSLELSSYHLNSCRKNGIYDVIICLDADERGKAKARVLLDDVLHNIHDLKIRFIFLPGDEDSKVDPDIFVRENGLAAFLALNKIDPFEWRLREFETDDDSDAESICFAMIPIISNEPSSIRRERMIKELSDYTGYSDKVIREELEKIKDSEENRIQSKRDAVKDVLRNKLDKRQDSMEIILQKTLDDLHSIEKEHSAGKLDANTQINNILAIKEYEETEELHSALSFGENFRTFSTALSGDLRQKFLLLGGTANTGKTTTFVNLAMNLAMYNDDILPIMLTIDDSLKELLPRLVTYDMAHRNYHTNPALFDLMSINKTATPFLYKNNVEYDALMEEREISFKKVVGLARDERLVLLDSDNGRTIDYIVNVIKFYRDRFPEKRIMFFLDNFHLVEVPGMEDGRSKYKTLSGDLKQTAVANDVTIFATVEYTKIPKGQKPGNTNVAETVALEYDSNAMIHLYSNLHDMREASNKWFYSIDGSKYPVIEADFGKNKINGFKDTIFYKFYPDKAYYAEITRAAAETIEDSNALDQERAAFENQNTPADVPQNRFGNNEQRQKF
jgi:DNA primase